MNTNGIHISEWVASLDVRKPFYLAIINQEGALTFTNSGFYTRFLSSPEAMTHHSFFDLIHWGDQALFKDLLAASSYQEEPVTGQIRIHNGFWRWVKWEVSCIKRNGQPEKFLCLGYDIADEVQLVKTKQIMELNYQTMIEDMNVGILLQDAEGGVISANRKAAEIFNTTLEELYSRKSISVLGEIGAGKVQRNSVCNIQLPGGSYRTLLCNSQPIFDQPELPAQAVVSTFQDITREIEFERVAKDREALFSAFMDHSPFFSWIVDKEDNLQYANKSLLEYFRVNETAYGKKLADIIPGPLAGIIREKHLALQYKKEDRSIVKFRLDDGEEHIYQVVVFPIHGAAPDSLVGGGALDITESYRARQEEKRVTEQLREMEFLLAKQKLKEQKGIAEAIIKAQEDERTRIGHELHDNINQILASGQLYLTVLTKDIEDFQEIKDKTLEILQLAIEEVRVLSKGMVLPDLKKGGLVASIDDLALDLRVGNLFEVEFSHSPTGQLEQMSQSKKVTLFRIVQEQTKNIIKYSHAKRVKIGLDLDIDRVRLEITDDGQGFDAANTRRGLGLSNIFERSRLYDGNAILSTAPGKGCCIIVNIPFGCHPAIR